MMKSALIFDDIFSLHRLRPSPMLVRKGGMMLAIYAALTVITFGTVKAVTADWLPSCRNGDVILQYPIYSARGVEIDHTFECGKLRRVCSVKTQTSRGPVYECPGLMRSR